MKKVYYLSTCDTCKRIMQQVDDLASWEQVDIKKNNISAEDLDTIAEKSGGYEAVFSKRSRKYRAHNLHEQTLQDQDYRRLILEEYTFLKRPVWITDDQVFVGNTKKVVAALLAYNG